MEVLVETGSRLHAGFHYIGRGVWGGCGFYVEKPRLRIKAWRCSNSSYRGAAELSSVLDHVLGVLKGICVDVLEEIPSHVGLGSTTQATLALALAYKVLYEARDSIYRLAYRLGRGRYSWVGTLLFTHGGFIADAGTGTEEPRILARLDVPSDWRFLVVLPGLEKGYGENLEEKLLTGNASPSPRSSSLMAQGALKLMMGVARENLDMALEGLKNIQLGTGMYFSKYQGGRYRRDLIRVVEEAERNGIILAQSSWGPTLYTITTVDHASGDAYIIKSILKETGIGGEVVVSKPRNRGAEAAYSKL